MFRQRKQIKKLLLNIVLVILTSILMFSGVFLYCWHVLYVPDPIDYVEYVVQEGDTLWDIAHQSNGFNKVDIREIIDDIEDKSNCSGSIVPGDIVYIPVYEN